MEQRLYELPEGWEWKSLQELYDIARGGSPRPIKKYITTNEDGVNWIKIGDATASSKYIYQTKEKITVDGVKKSRMVNDGDFILSNSMSFGRPYIMKTSGCIHDGWLVLKPQTDAVFQDYAYHALSAPVTYRQFDNAASGSTVRNLNSDLVRKVRIPLPPLNEQKRIVSRLDALFTRIDAAITHLQETLELSKALFASALDEVFSDAANRFEVKPISEIFTITSGDGLTQKNMVKDGPYDVYGGNGISGRHNEYNRSGLNVVIGRVGAWCGNVRLVDGDIWVTDNAFFVKSYLADVFEPYLVAALQHLNLRDTANQAAQPVISYKGIKELPMPLPPMKEQAQIVTHLDALAEHTRTLEAETRVRLDQLATLKSSLLDSAFRGRL